MTHSVYCLISTGFLISEHRPGTTPGEPFSRERGDGGADPPVYLAGGGADCGDRGWGGVVRRSDHIGRPVFATDASGVKVWTAAYLPFGGVRVTTGTPPTARFPGQWFQSETGLHQNWMRDFDATTGYD